MNFGELLAEVNGLHIKGFKRWLFADGMAFLDSVQWWGGKVKRATPHEGVDFFQYETHDGQVEKLPSCALVPAVMDGFVVCIHDDFLGRTVWLRHGSTSEDGFCLYSVYGHITPNISLVVGAKVKAKDIIGVVVDSSVSKKVPPHLHLTVARIVSDVAPVDLCWPLVLDKSQVSLLDPRSL